LEFYLWHWHLQLYLFLVLGLVGTFGWSCF
jgi:hypothetical protein